MCGAVVTRMGMGTVLDVQGPCLGNAITLLLFTPPVCCICLVKTATDLSRLHDFTPVHRMQLVLLRVCE